MSKSSNYGEGDCGGSHGVSQGWITKHVKSGMKKATDERAGKFLGSADARTTRKQGGKKLVHAAKVARKQPLSHAGPGAKAAERGYESGWAKWRANGGGKKLAMHRTGYQTIRGGIPRSPNGYSAQGSGSPAGYNLGIGGENISAPPNMQARGFRQERILMSHEGQDMILSNYKWGDREVGFRFKQRFDGI
jgi:hypothetical protein